MGIDQKDSELIHPISRSAHADTAAPTPTPIKKPWWRKLLKVMAWVLVSLVALLLLLMCLVAWILTPEVLTPLVEKYGSQYLKADVKLGRAELTVWSSFPEIRLDVTDLKLTSRTLQGVPDSIMATLGPDATQLLEAHLIGGSINPWKMIGGTIALGNITAEGVNLNLVCVNDSVNNYTILPPSEKDEQEQSSWTIRYGDITLRNTNIRYYDATTRTDVRMADTQLHISPQDKECKSLATSLKGRLSLMSEGSVYLDRWPLDARGDMVWDMNTMDISLPDYKIDLAIFGTTLRAAMRMDDNPVLKQCSVALAPVPVADVLKVLPSEVCDEYPMLSQVSTNMQVSADVQVKCPWSMSSDTLPDVDVALAIPSSTLTLTDSDGAELLQLSDLQMDASLHYDGAAPELSLLQIPLFKLAGSGFALDLHASIYELLSDDPLISIASKGRISLNALAGLLKGLGITLRGEIEADAEVRGRLSDMMELNYEKLEADGNMLMQGFLCEMPASAMRIWSHIAKLQFGNALQDSHIHTPGTLLARAEVDTISYRMDGIELGVSQATVKAGASGKLLTQGESDAILPMGVKLQASLLRMHSAADTTRIKARNLRADGSITRYHGQEKSPNIQATLNADALKYSDPTMRLRTKQTDATINVHPRQKHHKNHAKRHKQSAGESESNMLRLDVDEGIKALFRQWGVEGSLASKSLRLTHLLYPVPVSVKGLKMDYSLDSIRLYPTHISTQRNALTLSGTISNLRQLMLGRTRKPFKVRLQAAIDSLDINQIAYNFTLGSALEMQRGHLARLSEDEQDAIVRAAAAIDTVQASASDSLPLIIPRNIDLAANISARKALYGDINLYDLRTDLVVNDGAASVDSLTAHTDFGDAYLNLLYSSRNPKLLNMAIDLGFSNIYLPDFYRTFPTVTEMAPAITDLSGMVCARLIGSLNMYPNMDIDFGSINAALNLSGTQLELTQSPLIRKVARMMLIRKKGPLQISDMDIQVSLHDNVVRLYPFKFGFEKYRFALLGQNDLDENMYYHLSVLKSPIPFKFGINVKGTFDKPKIRFGGPKYKEGEAQEMLNLVESHRVNFVHAMRLELRKLINKAAVSWADRQDMPVYDLRSSDDGEGDDSGFTSPMDKLGSAMKSPVSQTFSGVNQALQLFSQEHSDELHKDKKKKNKKK